MGGFIDSVGNLIGAGGSSTNGSGTIAQSANLLQPVTQNQVNAGAASATQGIVSEQDLINALAGQTSQGASSQNNLTTQLTNEANGVGPNPAQAALAQNTSNNISNQA